MIVSIPIFVMHGFDGLVVAALCVDAYDGNEEERNGAKELHVIVRDGVAVEKSFEVCK